MAEVGKDLRRSSCPTPPAKAGSSTAGCSGSCSSGTFYFSLRAVSHEISCAYHLQDTKH